MQTIGLILLGITGIIGGLALVLRGWAEYKASMRKQESASPTVNGTSENTQVSEASQLKTDSANTSAATGSSAKEHTPANSLESLKQLVDMAAADGIITPRERKKLSLKASDAGVSDDEVEKWIRIAMECQKEPPETELVDQQKLKGNQFEEWVVSKFYPDYFALLEWAGDKYHKGRYAETTRHPDLYLALKLKKGDFYFAVECKYRNTIPNEGLKWANEEQIKHYQRFAEDKDIPVFVVMGIGGQPKHPEEVYVIPLQEAKTPFFSRETLKQHKRQYPEKHFYYNPQKRFLQ